jgi:hypothetical protein
VAPGACCPAGSFARTCREVSFWVGCVSRPIFRVWCIARSWPASGLYRRNAARVRRWPRPDDETRGGSARGRLVAFQLMLFAIIKSFSAGSGYRWPVAEAAHCSVAGEAASRRRSALKSAEERGLRKLNIGPDFGDYRILGIKGTDFGERKQAVIVARTCCRQRSFCARRAVAAFSFPDIRALNPRNPCQCFSSIAIDPGKPPRGRECHQRRIAKVRGQPPPARS